MKVSKYGVGPPRMLRFLYLLVILSLPIQDYSLGNLGGLVVDLSPLQLLTTLVLILTFFWVLRNRLKLHLSPRSTTCYACLAGFLLFTLLSTVVNGLDVLPWLRSLLLISMILVCPVLLLNSQDAYHQVFRAVCGAAVLAAVLQFLASLELIESIRFQSGRPIASLGSVSFYRTPGLLSNYGDLAALYGFGAVFSITFIVESIKKVNRLSLMFWLFSIAIIGVSALLTNSRNVWLSVGVSLIVYVAAIQKRRNRVNIAIVFLSVLTIVACSLAYTEGTLATLYEVPQRLYEDMIEMRSDAVVTRVDMYGIGVEQLKEKPFWGIGPRSFEYFVGEKSLPMHNTVINAFLYAGVFGGILFLIALVLIGRGLIGTHGRTPTTKTVLASYAGLLVAVQFYGGLYSEVFWELLSLFIAYSSLKGKSVIN